MNDLLALLLPREREFRQVARFKSIGGGGQRKGVANRGGPRVDGVRFSGFYVV